jgi:hypothetical protein
MSQQINLYNPIFLKQRKIFSAVTMVQALALIVLGALAFAGFARYQVGRLEAEVRSSEARAKAEETRLTRLSAEFTGRKKSTELEQELKRSEQELKAREAILALVSSGALGQTQGISAFMRALARQNIDGLWLTGFSVAGKEVAIRGRALRPELLPEYLHRLGREDTMQGRQFSTLLMQEPETAANGTAGAKVQGQTPAMPRFIEFSLQTTPPKEGK